MGLLYQEPALPPHNLHQSRTTAPESSEGHCRATDQPWEHTEQAFALKCPLKCRNISRRKNHHQQKEPKELLVEPGLFWCNYCSGDTRQPEVPRWGTCLEGLFLVYLASFPLLSASTFQITAGIYVSSACALPRPHIFIRSSFPLRPFFFLLLLFQESVLLLYVLLDMKCQVQI